MFILSSQFHQSILAPKRKTSSDESDFLSGRMFSFQWPILIWWVVEDLMKWWWKEKSLDTNSLSHLSSLHQNSMRKNLQVLKHLPCDGVIASDLAAFDIPWLIEKHTHLIGGVWQWVWRGSELPVILHDFSQCRAVCFHSLIVEKVEKIVEAGIYLIGSVQYWRRPQRVQCSPRQTLSNCSQAASIRDASSVSIPASKLRRLLLFMPIPAPVRLAEPM